MENVEKENENMGKTKTMSEDHKRKVGTDISNITNKLLKTEKSDHQQSESSGIIFARIWYI